MSISNELTTRTLNDGVKIPTLAYGTATAHWSKECSPDIILALNKGFRHIDTAHGYQNEASVGKALREWGGKRDEVFITTKWGCAEPDYEHDAEMELKNSLEDMGVDYVDLYLIHLPSPKGNNNIDAWKKMEDFHQRGLVRSIGISSFRAEHIEELAKIWAIKPSVNQIEYHPYCYHDPRMAEMEETCKKYDIAVSPFTCLASITHYKGGPVDAVIEAIGEKKGITPAQVLLAWARQKTDGGPIVTTASKEWQYQQIIDSLDILLDEEEILEIDEAGKRGRVKGTCTIPRWDEAENNA